MKNGNFIVKLEDYAGVDDQILAKSINQMPCHLGSYILSHSKRSMNNFIWEIYGFYWNKIHYGHTDSAYHHKKQWSALVEKCFVGRFFGLSNNDYSLAYVFHV